MPLSRDTQPLSQLHLPKGNRKPLRPGDLRKLLDECKEPPTANGLSDLSGPTKRVVSDPIPRRPTAFSTALSGVQRASSLTRVITEPTDSLAFTNLVRGRSERTSSDSRKFEIPSDIRVPTPDSSDDPAAANPEPTPNYDTAARLPIGTTRPTRLTTTGLVPRSHKTIQGQVVILSSRSLLVDFREGERRRGNPGSQVFVVTADGLNIKLYNAPHLSTPCCLVEPVWEGSLGSLPPILWKQYNDAADLVERIKQRTPKLVLQESNIKCTLMTNGPLADLEVLLSSVPDTESGSQSAVRMRLRLSRKAQTIELARLTVSDMRGNEWKKKYFPSISDDYGLSAKERASLDDDERAGLEVLSRFLQLCRAHEKLFLEFTSGNDELNDLASLSFSSGAGRIQTEPKWRSSVRARILTSSTTTNSSTLPVVELHPRPAKLNGSRTSGPVRFSASLEKENRSVPSSFLTSRASPNYNDPTLFPNSDTTAFGLGVATKYIPSVGWCVRQASRISQGGRYRIMFLDGVALDVNVDEEWTELRDTAGHVMRCGIRERRMNRAIGDRLRAFHRFVALFEDEE